MGFSRGWREFSLAEDVSDGDVCVFELLDTTPIMRSSFIPLGRSESCLEE